VPAPPEQAWALLMDVPRVIPCMPGAELVDTVDESSWKARVAVKLGPIALSFDSDVRREEADEVARRARLAVRARETRGRGEAQASIESTLVPLDGGTRVEVVTDLSLSGPLAQYGRGVVHDVASQLVASFADCLRRQLAGSQGEVEAATQAQARPVSGLRVGLAAILRSLARLLRLRRSRAEGGA